MAINPYTRPAEHNLINTYAGIPTDAFGKAMGEIQHQEDVLDNTLIKIGEKTLDPLTGARERSSEILNEYQTSIQGIYDKGNLRDQAKDVKKLQHTVHNTFDNPMGEGYLINQDKKNYLSYVTDVEKDKGLNDERKAYYKQLAVDGYSAPTKNADGTFTSNLKTPNTVDYVDVAEELTDRLSKVKMSITTRGGFGEDANGNMVNYLNEKGQVKYEDLKTLGKAYVYKSSEMTASIKEDAKKSAYYTFNNLQPGEFVNFEGKNYTSENAEEYIDAHVDKQIEDFASLSAATLAQYKDKEVTTLKRTALDLENQRNKANKLLENNGMGAIPGQEVTGKEIYSKETLQLLEGGTPFEQQVAKQRRATFDKAKKTYIETIPKNNDSNRKAIEESLNGSKKEALISALPFGYLLANTISENKKEVLEVINSSGTGINYEIYKDEKTNYEKILLEGKQKLKNRGDNQDLTTELVQSMGAAKERLSEIADIEASAKMIVDNQMDNSVRGLLKSVEYTPQTYVFNTKNTTAESINSVFSTIGSTLANYVHVSEGVGEDLTKLEEDKAREVLASLTTMTDNPSFEIIEDASGGGFLLQAKYTGKVVGASFAKSYNIELPLTDELLFEKDGSYRAVGMALKPLLGKSVNNQSNITFEKMLEKSRINNLTESSMVFGTPIHKNLSISENNYSNAYNTVEASLVDAMTQDLEYGEVGVVEILTEKNKPKYVPYINLGTKSNPQPQIVPQNTNIFQNLNVKEQNSENLFYANSKADALQRVRLWME